MVAGAQRRDHRCIADQHEPWRHEPWRHDFEHMPDERPFGTAPPAASSRAGAAAAQPRGPDDRRHRRGHRRPPRPGRDDRAHRARAHRPCERLRRRRLRVRLARAPDRGLHRDDRRHAPSRTARGSRWRSASCRCSLLVLLLGSALHASFLSSWGLPILDQRGRPRPRLPQRRGRRARLARRLGEVPAAARLRAAPVAAVVLRPHRRRAVLFFLGVVVISDAALRRSWFRPFGGSAVDDRRDRRRLRPLVAAPRPRPRCASARRASGPRSAPTWRPGCTTRCCRRSP